MVDVELLVRAQPDGEPAPEGDARPPMVASLSPSSMATWRQCPKRFWFEKILRLPVEASEPAVCGSFVHLVLEQLMSRPAGERTADTARAIAGEVWPAFVTDPDSRFTELALDATATRAFKQRAWAGIAGYFLHRGPQPDRGRRHRAGDPGRARGRARSTGSSTASTRAMTGSS